MINILLFGDIPHICYHSCLRLWCWWAMLPNCVCVCVCSMCAGSLDMRNGPESVYMQRQMETTPPFHLQRGFIVVRSTTSSCTHIRSEWAGDKWRDDACEKGWPNRSSASDVYMQTPEIVCGKWCVLVGITSRYSFYCCRSFRINVFSALADIVLEFLFVPSHRTTIKMKIFKGRWSKCCTA